MAIKNRWLNVRISDKDRKQLRKDAEKEGRSMASLLIRLWKEWRND